MRMSTSSRKAEKVGKKRTGSRRGNSSRRKEQRALERQATMSKKATDGNRRRSQNRPEASMTITTRSSLLGTGSKNIGPSEQIPLLERLFSGGQHLNNLNQTSDSCTENESFIGKDLANRISISNRESRNSNKLAAPSSPNKGSSRADSPSKPPSETL